MLLMLVARKEHLRHISNSITTMNGHSCEFLKRATIFVASISLLITAHSITPANALEKRQVLGHQLFTPASIIGQFFIATSAEYNSNPPELWDSFVNRVVDNSVKSCMIKFGFKARELRSVFAKSPGFPEVDNVDYPDVNRLRKGQLGLVPIPGAKNIVTIPPKQLGTFRTDIDTCNARPIKLLTSVDRRLDPIYQAWGNDLSLVWKTRRVIQATKEWSSCVARRGTPASSPDEWFGNLDTLIHSYSTYRNPYLAPKVVALVREYGDCVLPLSKALDKIRLVDRSRLIEKIERELPRLARQMNAIVRNFDKKS